MNRTTTRSGSLQHVLPMVVPAILIGILCSLSLLGVDELALQLEHLWWHTLPAWVGIDADSRLLIAVVLLTTAVLVALVVRFAPGNAGKDPATLALVEAPVPLRVVPGLLAAVILTLAGGVSLGPENPIIAANIALVFWVGSRVMPSREARNWVALAMAGTIGALFGTAIAAALLLTEIIASRPAGPAAQQYRPLHLWDELTAPMLAAAAGALTTLSMGGASLSLGLPDYPELRVVDVLTGTAVAIGAAVIGQLACWAFPWIHRGFARLGHQWRAVLVGGVVLALLGVLGGPLTLFKGLGEMQTLAGEYATWSVPALLGLVAVRLLALMVASASGFRGGRIFPTVFAGIALGFAAHQAVPSIPVAVAVSCATIGILVAVTRSGWLSLFMAVVIIPDGDLVIVLCVATVAAWLTVTGRHDMEVDPAEAIPA